MITAIIFFTSLILMVLMLLFKEKEIRTGQNLSLFGRLHWSMFDPHFGSLFLKLKIWIKGLNYRNVKLIFLKIIDSIKKVIIRTKRRFDHKGSKFFMSREKDVPKSKGPVSFFLKNVSDYKKELRENEEIKKSEEN